MTRDSQTARSSPWRSHGHLLVDGVALEQQLALVAHVLADELVGHALEAQRHRGAVDEGAAAGADELHRLAHLGLAWLWL
jgi:hypothetical protein